MRDEVHQGRSLQGDCRGHEWRPAGGTGERGDCRDLQHEPGYAHEVEYPPPLQIESHNNVCVFGLRAGSRVLRNADFGLWTLDSRIYTPVHADQT